MSKKKDKPATDLVRERVESLDFDIELGMKWNREKGLKGFDPFILHYYSSKNGEEPYLSSEQYADCTFEGSIPELFEEARGFALDSCEEHGLYVTGWTVVYHHQAKHAVALSCLKGQAIRRFKAPLTDYSVGPWIEHVRGNASSPEMR